MNESDRVAQGKGASVRLEKERRDARSRVPFPAQQFVGLAIIGGHNPAPLCTNLYILAFPFMHNIMQTVHREERVVCYITAAGVDI